MSPERIDLLARVFVAACVVLVIGLSAAADIACTAVKARIFLGAR